MEPSFSNRGQIVQVIAALAALAVSLITLWLNKSDNAVVLGLIVLVAVLLLVSLANLWANWTHRTATASTAQQAKPEANRIRITSPRAGEVLVGRKPLGPASSSFEVSGTLKHLPNDHKIWLLVKDESSARIWPQGFENVRYNENDGTWTGRINPGVSGSTNVTIIAVVAPPTSHEFFQYFQKVGVKMLSLNPPDKISFEPLERIPTECRNVYEVQAKKP